MITGSIYNIIPPPDHSILCCGCTKASQSEVCVGSRPIVWHLYIAMATQSRLPMQYTSFWNGAWSPSICLNVFCAEISACMGRINIMPTIMMGNTEIVLPAIHMMNTFMGTCLMGPRAMSHDLLFTNVGSTSLILSAALWVSTNPTGLGRFSDDGTTVLSLRPLPDATNSIDHLCFLLDIFCYKGI